MSQLPRNRTVLFFFPVYLLFYEWIMPRLHKYEFLWKYWGIFYLIPWKTLFKKSQRVKEKQKKNASLELGEHETATKMPLVLFQRVNDLTVFLSCNSDEGNNSSVHRIVTSGRERGHTRSPLMTLHFLASWYVKQEVDQSLIFANWKSKNHQLLRNNCHFISCVNVLNMSIYHLGHFVPVVGKFIISW